MNTETKKHKHKVMQNDHKEKQNGQKGTLNDYRQLKRHKHKQYATNWIKGRTKSHNTTTT